MRRKKKIYSITSIPQCSLGYVLHHHGVRYISVCIDCRLRRNLWSIHATHLLSIAAQVCISSEKRRYKCMASPFGICLHRANCTSAAAGDECRCNNHKINCLSRLAIRLVASDLHLRLKVCDFSPSQSRNTSAS